jgi:hypothetical protein
MFTGYVVLAFVEFFIFLKDFSKKNLVGKPSGSSLHFVDGTQCEPVGADYSA